MAALGGKNIEFNDADRQLSQRLMLSRFLPLFTPVAFIARLCSGRLRPEEKYTILQFLPQRTSLILLLLFSITWHTDEAERDPMQTGAFKPCLQAGVSLQDSAADMLTAPTFTAHAVPRRTTRTTPSHMELTGCT